MKTITDIINDLQSAANSGNAGLFAENFIAYEEFRKTSRNATLYQFGINPAKETTKAIANITTQNREDAILKRAEEYIKGVDIKGTHKERKEKIESALSLLIGLYKSNKEILKPQTFTLIARTYLLRSLIIRPKGRTVPEKKKEALEKGMFFVNNAIKQLNHSSGETFAHTDKSLLEEAWRVKGQLCLELNHCGVKNYCEGFFIVSILKQSMDNGCKKFNVWKTDTKIAIRYSEIERDDQQYLCEIIKPSAKGNDLEKAKAYYMLGDKFNNNFEKHIGNTIKYLRTRPFSDPLWEETVCFIRKLKEDKNRLCRLWKKLALDTYEACLIQERRTSAIRLRWHWSRQRDLYDLAFLAALDAEDRTDDEKYQKMAEIGDSHKSRSSLRWTSLETMAKSNKELEQTLKAYESALIEEYIKDFEAVQETIDERETPPPGGMEITEAPPGWVIVHFYLNRLEDKGYALIYNADEKTWEMRDFLCGKLFNDFLTWQINYSRHKEQAANHLIQLCKEIGNAMPFLFDENIIPQGKDVLFIPHDFLHRLPLHGAINKEATSNKLVVFLENHPCCYLPALSFATGKNDIVGQGRLLLKNFPEYPYEALIFDSKIWTSPVKDTASADDLKTIDTPPEMLVILCHGESDVTNPFNARLKLAKGGISHLEILRLVKKFQGSYIVLGACETDLVPPLSDVVDEHLSIATAFLTNETHEILGTMWEVFPLVVESIIVKVGEKIIGTKHTGMNTKAILWKFQKETIDDYGIDPMRFYQTIAFRITGISK